MMWLQSAIPFIGVLLLFQRTTAQMAQQYHFINTSMTWYEAQSFCRVKYSDLATVNSMSDKNNLVHMLGGHVTYTWIGLQKGKTDRWMWSDGRGTARFTNWKYGEPNGEGNECCAEMSDTGLWNDAQCGGEKYFACYEIQPDGTQRYVFYPKSKSWVRSQELCRSRHVDMAYVGSEVKNSEIANQAKNWNNQMWIGLFNDAWMWSDGSQTSFRFWLMGSHYQGDCASVAVSQQGRWVEANCNEKVPFVCHGGLKVKKMIIRMTVSSDVDLTNSTLSDAVLEKVKSITDKVIQNKCYTDGQLEMILKEQRMTDFNLSWRSDNNVFQRHEQLDDAEKRGC